MYPLEAKVQARTCYVEAGMTYEEVAEETGVSLSQLKTWGVEGNWFKERTEYERSFLEMSSNVQRVKVKLAQEALTSRDPQKIYALARLMQVSAPGSRRTNSVDKAALTIEILGKMVEYCKARDPEALRYLEPHIRGFADSLKQPEAA